MKITVARPTNGRSQQHSSFTGSRVFIEDTRAGEAAVFVFVPGTLFSAFARRVKSFLHNLPCGIFCKDLFLLPVLQEASGPPMNFSTILTYPNCYPTHRCVCNRPPRSRHARCTGCIIHHV